MKILIIVLLALFCFDSCFGQVMDARHYDKCHQSTCVYIGDYSIDFRDGNDVYTVNVTLPNNSINNYGRIIYTGAGPLVVESYEYIGGSYKITFSRDTPYMFHHPNENFYFLFEATTDKINNYGYVQTNYFYHIGFYVIQN